MFFAQGGAPKRRKFFKIAAQRRYFFCDALFVKKKHSLTCGVERWEREQVGDGGPAGLPACPGIVREKYKNICILEMGEA